MENDEASRKTFLESLEQFVNSEIRPFLQEDGGDIQILEFRSDGVLRVSLQGACSACPSSGMTLKYGVERRIKEKFPEVKELELAGVHRFFDDL